MQIRCDPSPPGGGRAVLKTRPYAQAGDKFPHYELNLFRICRPQADQAGSGPASSMNGEELCRLHWAKDGIHFTYSQEDPRSSTPAGSSRWMPTPARCATWWDERTRDFHLDDAHGRAGNPGCPAFYLSHEQ